MGFGLMAALIVSAGLGLEAAPQLNSETPQSEINHDYSKPYYQDRDNWPHWWQIPSNQWDEHTTDCMRSCQLATHPHERLRNCELIYQPGVLLNLCIDRAIKKFIDCVNRCLTI